MKRILFVLVAVFALTLVFNNTSYAQAKKKVAVYGQKGDGGVKVSIPGDDKPRDKNNKRGYCYVYFDNYTGYYVDIWVENIYQGRLSPYSTSVRIDVWTPGNWTKWYAKSSGGTYYWTNDSFCNDSRIFTINLK